MVVDADVMGKLLEKTRLGAEQVTARLQSALEPAYWRQLNPGFSIGSGCVEGALEELPLDDARLNQIREKYAEEGYYRTEPALTPTTIRRLRECIDRLQREDWPPVFAFVYDEFWMVPRLPSITRLLTALIGPGYRQMMGWIWVNTVNSQKGSRGWRPHLDGAGVANRVTLWIALSDATTENGCMYVVPRTADTKPAVERVFASRSDHRTVNFADLQALLQSSRALPARSGALLGWSPDVIHWGARCVGASEPRIAVSQHFIAAGEEPNRGEVPLIDPLLALPSFAQRLQVIAEAIISYQRFEPLLIKYREFAERLRKEITPAAAA